MSDTKGEITRRDMVGAAAVGLGVLWAVDAPALTRRLAKRLPAVSRTAKVSRAAPSPPMGSYADWAQQVGSYFYLRAPTGSIMMKLASVQASPAVGVRPAELKRREGFDLLFDTGRVAAPQAEGIYTVTHRKFGVLQVFLVPSSLSATGLRAVFN